MTETQRAAMLARYASHREAIEGLATELDVSVARIIGWAVELGLRSTRPIRPGRTQHRWGSITTAKRRQQQEEAQEA